ncbi:MAG TPA: hypothetical protein DEP05_06645, partial [Betaproteobacteria bacterium]|nr:hypothetical protein [Betaproteobacteria bacterium]
FIPIAEETGLIIPIGEWVLRTACAQNAAWRKAGYPALRVAVNLSSRQFHQTDLVEQVRLALEETGLEPQGLELEITESMAMEHAEDTIVKLKQLKALGVSISMDDFGAGHSSLSDLKRLPIDTLKIDKSFVEDLGDGSGDAVITRAIADMAKGLRLKVISEGVETEEQLAFLKTHNNSEVQGYLFSHPLPAEEFAELLKNPLPGGRPPS